MTFILKTAAAPPPPSFLRPRLHHTGTTSMTLNNTLAVAFVAAVAVAAAVGLGLPHLSDGCVQGGEAGGVHDAGRVAHVPREHPASLALPAYDAGILEGLEPRNHGHLSCSFFKAVFSPAC